ncbi:MAG: pseudouridine synthase [bacterium]|jgi:23S rRNA pseudouridine2605 synthase/16S rRNA pseudouridine516 synthase
MQETMSPRVRLNKFLRDCALGSRRKCEDLITGGRVRINGEVVTDLATLVDAGADTVEVDGETLAVREKVYVAAYKPVGSIVTAADPHGRKTVFDAVSGLPDGLFAVGRLDMDSDGLVIMTNDGKLSHRLAHPRYQVPRVYTVAVEGAAGEDLAGKLKAGVELEDGPARAVEARIVGEYEGGAVMEIVMTEGRKREIRRMLAACGYEVTSLTRKSFGGVGLGSLSRGEWRYLSRDEVRTLRRNTEGAN